MRSERSAPTPPTHIELIDERDAVAVIESPRFRVELVDGSARATYALDGSLAGVRAWADEHAGDGGYSIYVEVPLEGEPGSVLLARVDGSSG